MRDRKNSVLYPWQNEGIYSGKKYKTMSRQNCTEWYCKWPGCPIKLNDIETKNRRKEYCAEHNALLRKSRRSYAQMIAEAERMRKK